MSGDKNPILLMLQKDENVTTTLDCKRNTTRQEQTEENAVKIFNRNFENITDVYRTGNLIKILQFLFYKNKGSGYISNQRSFDSL